jgi:hypothetical protein
MQLSTPSRHFIPPQSKYPVQSTLFSVYVPHLMSETKFHTHTEPYSRSYLS